jgi:large subunit ribosomal protein L13
MKTIFINEKDAVRDWFVIDAAEKPLGRIAAKVAYMLRGKHKPSYAPHQEMGDYIVIVNAEKVAVTGNKASDKMYYHHTGYVGGLKSFTFQKLIERHPEDPLKLAIRGMLPKGRLGRKLLKNVKIYAGASHPHAPQNPKPLAI